MSRADNEAEPEKKKTLLPLSRIAVLVFVILAAVLIYVEWQAKSAQDETYNAVTTAFDTSEKKGDALYLQDVERLLQGSYERTTVEPGVELFTWSGLFKNYHLRVESEADGFVKRIAPE